MKYLTPKRILVTGANGFIGRRVIARLKERSPSTAVRAFVLPNEAIPNHWDDEVEVLRGDIRNQTDLSTAIADCDGLIHLAAVVGDWAPWADFQSITIDATENILNLAAQQNVRATLVSSIVVYGTQIGQKICHEELAHGQPCGPYSRSKQAQEVIAKRLVAEMNLQLCIIRPANVYGPGPSPWTVGVIDELKRGAPTIIGQGQGCAGMVYVDHVADILALSQLVPEAMGSTINAADGNTVSWKEYFSAIAQVAGCKPPGKLPLTLAKCLAPALETLWRGLHIKGRPPLTREAFNLVGNDNQFPGKAAKEILGFEPWVSFDQAMTLIADWIANPPND